MFHKHVMSAVSIEGYMICIAVLLESLAIFNAVKTALPVEVKLLQIWDFYVYFTKEARLSYLSPTDIRDADFSWLFCGQPSGSRPAKEKAHATRRVTRLMRISTDSRHDDFLRRSFCNFTGISSVALPHLAPCQRNRHAGSHAPSTATAALAEVLTLQAAFAAAQWMSWGGDEVEWSKTWINSDKCIQVFADRLLWGADGWVFVSFKGNAHHWSMFQKGIVVGIVAGAKSSHTAKVARSWPGDLAFAISLVVKRKYKINKFVSFGLHKLAMKFFVHEPWDF